MLPSALVIIESVSSTVDAPDGAGSDNLRSWAAILLSSLAMVAGSVPLAVEIWEVRIWYNNRSVRGSWLDESVVS